MDELRVDWGSVGLRHFHVAVDLATSYLWVKEYQVMSTQNSLLHLKEIMGVFGCALSVGETLLTMSYELAFVSHCRIRPRKTGSHHPDQGSELVL